jgi:NAD(P)-dependent dehydrogenase (short-subunit alcohol dehydrogenase family)
MAGIDQYYLDTLSSISKDVQKLTADFADATDRHLDAVYSSIRDTLSSASWLPESARPRPPPPPPTFFQQPQTYLQQIETWILRNRALSAAIVAFLGTGGFLVYHQRRSQRKRRRARRASNGARQEVVVIAGPPASPITKSLALDLDRKGFVVFVVANSDEEEHIIANDLRSDIKPLPLMISDPQATKDAIDHFSTLIAKPHQAFMGATRHKLDLAGVILVPDLVYPSGPVESVPLDLWSDALNLKVLGSVATIQAFLPVIRQTQSRVLVLTPGIVSVLGPPFHGVESTVVGALEGFTNTLRSELNPLGIPVCQLRTGTFDCNTVGDRRSPQSINANSPLGWAETTRSVYAANYLAHSQTKGILAPNSNATKGSQLRILHHAVFDALTQKRPRPVWRVGRGSLAYDIVGRCFPTSLVGWMLGQRRVVLGDMTQEAEQSLSMTSWERV